MPKCLRRETNLLTAETSDKALGPVRPPTSCQDPTAGPDCYLIFQLGRKNGAKTD